MDKLLLFPGKSDRGIFTYVIDTEQPYLVKTAAEYHPEIASYINSAQRIPGKTQILLTALGAGEWWGDNVNGDYFPELALAHPGDDYGYRTFQTTAKVYKHHINKDPTASYGDVALSVYNPKYHRVELIIVLDNAKAPDIAQRIDDGDYPEWSMGCRVPYDVCSICGNKAPTRREYCEHLKYYMGRIHPETGKKAYAINLHPKFFDISQVLIGADKIAKTLRKVASSGAAVAIGSAYLAEKMAVNKSAEIEKEVPTSEPPASQEAVDTLVPAIAEVKSKEAPLPTSTLDTLGGSSLSKALSTLAVMGILPKPQEFQRIVLISIGKRDVADQLDSQNLSFDPMSVPEPDPSHMKLVDMGTEHFSPGLMNSLSPHVADRSYYAPHLARRMVIMIKSASQEEYLPQFLKEGDRKPLGIMPLMMLIAGMYAAFGKKLPETAAGLDKVIMNHPGLAMALAASVPMIFNQMAGTKTKGQFDVSGVPENPDVSDLFSRIEEKKQKPYLKVASVMGPFSKRLLLGVPLAYMASGILQKHKDATPYEQESRIKAFVRKNPDIIGAAIAADAMMSLQGKGSHGAMKNMVQGSKGFWEKAQKLIPHAKLASASDFLTNAVVWPVAFGGANLPARVVGGLFDQAFLDLSKKVLSNKNGGPRIENTNRRI